MEINHTPETERLFEAILKLENAEECFCFFEDIMTVKELEAISQRLQVAEMLLASHSYQDICRRTGASTATISRVNRCLQAGTGGYRMIMKKLKEETNT